MTDHPSHNQASSAFLKNFSKTLVLCSHTDDEFGCAGTVCRLVDAGVQVRYLALSKCEQSLRPDLPKDTLVHECMAATRTLGIPPENVEIDSFPVRYFPKNRQDILEKLVRLNREYAPDLVLLPTSFDTHQDHRVVYEEGFRAFKHTTLLGYELPQNLTSFNNTAFVALTPEVLRRKVDALAEYRSQSHRDYSSADFIEGLGRVRGVQCGATYAEAFEMIRLIVR